MTVTIFHPEPVVPVRRDVAEFLGRAPTMLIGGRWVPSASGATIRVTNPADGIEIARVPAGDREDVDRAVSAARQAFDSGPWGRMSAPDRTRLILRLADLVEQTAEKFGQLLTLDLGRPLGEAVGGDVPATAEVFRYMAGWTTKITGDTIPFETAHTFHVYTRPEPVGVVAQIIPWNGPLNSSASKLAPALAAGCTVILKPAEQAPLAPLLLGELIEAAGFPPGVVNIVTGYGAAAGAALAAHPDVDKIVFTGSTQVGKLIIGAATGNLKRVSLELGGKSPDIVFDDADLEAAIPAVAAGIFRNAGQVCVAGSRLFVERGVYQDVLDGVAAAARRIQVGHGLDPRSEMGPLVSARQLQRVSGYLDQAVAEGAEPVAGGGRIGQVGHFFEPTLLTGVHDGMKVTREEIFGPVLTATVFDDVDEVVARANDTIYGLAAGLWTRDLSRAHRVASRLKAGRIWINTYGGIDPSTPFGGFKQSGWGRERGREGVELYTELKSVVVRL